LWAAEKSARRSNELSGGGCRFAVSPVPEPRPAVPLLIAGLSRSASASGVAGDGGRAALARVGRAGSLGFLGGFAIRPNMGRVRRRGKVSSTITGASPNLQQFSQLPFIFATAILPK
jgi:hypothetical protein